jgi:hypothetical protein
MTFKSFFSWALSSTCSSSIAVASSLVLLSVSVTELTQDNCGLHVTEGQSRIVISTHVLMSVVDRNMECEYGTRRNFSRTWLPPTVWS